VLTVPDILLLQALREEQVIDMWTCCDLQAARDTNDTASFACLTTQKNVGRRGADSNQTITYQPVCPSLMLPTATNCPARGMT
jgi:hypothetical protein